MEKYKPGYLGKVLPADNPQKMTDFCMNKYDSFSKAYDTIKDQSENIKDISVVEPPKEDTTSLSIKVSTDTSTMEKIKESSNDPNININNDIVTATV